MRVAAHVRVVQRSQAAHRFSQVMGFVPSLSLLLLAVLVDESLCQDAPQIVPFSWPHGIETGNPFVAVTCVARGSGPLLFRWMKDGNELKTSERSLVRQTDKHSTLGISNLEIGDRGNYSCLVSNSAGSDSFTAALNVKQPPKFIHEPVDVSVGVGAKLSVPCRAIGYPEPTVTWTSLDSKAVTVVDGVLVFDRADTSIRGRYRCQASGAGEPVFKDIEIRVNAPAKFTEKYALKSVKKGESAKLECAAEGDVPLTVTWTKDSTKITELSDRLEITDIPANDGIRSELTIRLAERQDGGVYVCVAENVYGKDEKSNKLLILEAPSAPTGLTLRESWSRSASILWTAPSASHIPVTGYAIQYWREFNGENKRLEEEQITASHTSFLLKNLHPGAHYVCSVVALNEIGRGPASSKLIFKTGEEEPTGAPLDFHAEAAGPTTIRVSWKSPPIEKWNGNPVGFYVGFRSSSDYSKPYSLRNVPFSSFASIYEYFLSGLIKGAEYSVIVKAYNNAGSGPETQEMIAKTANGELQSAPKFFLMGVTSDSVSLVFKMRLDDSRAPRMSGFTVHYRLDTSAAWKEAGIPAGISHAEGSFVVKNLNSDSVYHFYVTADNKLGNGDPSPILTVKTRSTDSFLLDLLQSGDQMTSFAGVRLGIKALVIIGAVIIVLVTLIIACVCLRTAKQKAQLPPFDYKTATLARPGMSDTESGAYMEAVHRYTDITGKPMMQDTVAMYGGVHEVKSMPSPGKQYIHRPLPQPNEPSSSNANRNSQYLTDANVYECPQYD